MNADKTLNDILVKLFNDLMEIEEKCLISGEFMNISGNDMHIIEAIGLDEPKRMSEVAGEGEFDFQGIDWNCSDVGSGGEDECYNRNPDKSN